MTLLVCSTLLFLLVPVNARSVPIMPAVLTTAQGPVAGIQKPVGDNLTVDVFYGIPFAQPPVGALRFQLPVPAGPWEGVLDGTKKPASCWQHIDNSFGRFPGVEMWNPNTARSEDCLYLNVWRPASSDQCSHNQPKSILVWIFGGGFYSGTTTLDVYDASELSARNDVIVVSIAYRLGALGFLYMGNDAAPGNVGLWDQALALKWVKDNAYNLGGSPDDITIFGESAGAASVGFQLLSPISRDYFKYAILQSASPLSEWAVVEPDLALNRSLQLASIVLCSGEDDNATIECLKSVGPELLVYNQWLLDLEKFSFAFVPVVDGVFIPDDPQKMAERGDIKSTRVLLGVNKNEGIFFNIFDFKNYLPLQGNGQIDEEQFREMLPQYFHNEPQINELAVKSKSRHDQVSFLELLDEYTGDKAFKCPVVQFGKDLARDGSVVYMYSFEHRVSTNPWPSWTGVVHGYELELLFGLPLQPGSNYSQEDKDVSVDMMRLWTTFAKTGNPTYGNQPSEWPTYSEDSKNYVIIDSHGLRVEQDLVENQCRIISEVTSRHLNTDEVSNVNIS